MAEVHFRKLELPLSGGLLRVDPQLKAGAVEHTNQLNDEGLVKNILRYFMLPLRRFPSVRALAQAQHRCG